MKKKIASFGLLALITVTLSASAQTDVSKEKLDEILKNAKSYTNVSPVYGQIVAFSMPSNFKSAFEKTNGPNYIREAVPSGESAKSWTQMITLTAVKGLSSNMNVTPQKFVESFAGGYKRACPESFSAKAISQAKIDGNDAFTAVVSCGTSPTSSGHTSEAMIIAAVKGMEDYYTLQWAIQGTASSTALEIDSNAWIDRFKLLMPFKLCKIVTGETMPFPSCVERK